MPKQAKFIDTNFFPCSIVVCDNKKTFAKLAKELSLSDPRPFPSKETFATVVRYVYDSGNMVIVISFNRERFDHVAQVDIYAAIAHEATHVCQFLMERIKEYDPSMEFEAYTVGWITKECINYLKLLKK